MPSKVKINPNGEHVHIYFKLSPLVNTNWEVKYLDHGGQELFKKRSTNDTGENLSFELNTEPGALINKQHVFHIDLVNPDNESIHAKASVTFKQGDSICKYVMSGEEQNQWSKEDEELGEGEYLGSEDGTGDQFRYKEA